MKITHNEAQEEIFDDADLPRRFNEATHIDRGPVLNFMVDSKNFVLNSVLDALSGLREHPVGSLEIGTALAVTGLAASRALPHRPTH